MSTSTPARKGDLILVKEVSHNSWSLAAYQEAKAAGQPLSDTDTSYRFGVVASATREGVVKTWHQLGYGDQLVSDCAEPIRYQQFWTVPARLVDVDAALLAAKAHHWPGHPEQPRAFNSFDEAKALIKPFLTTTVPS